MCIRCTPLIGLLKYPQHLLSVVDHELLVEENSNHRTFILPLFAGGKVASRYRVCAHVHLPSKSHALLHENLIKKNSYKTLHSLIQQGIRAHTALSAP